MMSIITAFLIKSIACSGIFYLYYQLFLKNRKMHTFNRYYLLGCVVLSLVLPALHFEWNSVNPQTSPATYKLLQIIDAGAAGPELLTKAEEALPIETVIVLLYAFISLVLFAILVYRWLWLKTVRRQGRIHYAEGIRVIYTWEKRAPFSYMNDLYWPSGMDHDDETGKRIWAHELVHIKQKHSRDKLMLQLVVIAFWINPFYWLIQRECALLHEFIADEAVDQSGDTEQLARMLLQTYFTGSNSLLLNTFFHSPIKRRIMMFQKNKRVVLRRARQLFVLPVIAASALLFSFSSPNTKAVRAEKTVTILLDAGHGGEDAGARNADGITEKDLNLAITNRIMQMAADYNIKVILIRPEDKYVTLLDRVAKTNNTKADLMLSVHVNYEAEGSRYQVIMDERNVMKGKSQKLASAINAQMQELGMKPEIYNKHLLILKDAKVPAVLLECGDITNPADVDMVMNDSKLHSLCDRILTGVVAYANSK